MGQHKEHLSTALAPFVEPLAEFLGAVFEHPRVAAALRAIAAPTVTPRPIDRNALAKALNLSLSTIARFRRSPTFPYVTKKPPRFDLEAVRRWLEQNEPARVACERIDPPTDALARAGLRRSA